MNKVKELSYKYYIAILEYEYYLSMAKREYLGIYHLPEENPGLYFKLSNFMRDLYEKDYMPWRLLKGDLKTELEKVFENRTENMMSYLRVFDGIWDTFYSMTQEDLMRYYKDSGKDIKYDKVQEEISDIACDISSTTKLDPKIYSKDTIKFQKIVSNFAEIEDDICKLYRGEFDKGLDKCEVQNEELER